MADTLRQFGYARCKRSDKGILRRYLRKVTELSRAQVARCIAEFLACGAIKDRRHPPAVPFVRSYTVEDIRLRAEMDALHDTLSATQPRSSVAVAIRRDGQTITRDVPNGRYVIGAEANTVAVVTDPLTAAESKPASWLFKDVFRVERAKVLTSTTGDGKPRWAYLRDTDSVDWKFVGSTEKMDLQKAQDNVSALIYVALADVTDPSQANFAKGIKVKVDTFDGFIYEVSFGDKTDKGLYHMKFTVSANLPKTRVVPKDEKPEDKEKADKAFEEQTKAYNEKLEREKKLEAWTYLISKTTVEPLLRERAQLLPEKTDEKKK